MVENGACDACGNDPQESITRRQQHSRDDGRKGDVEAEVRAAFDQWNDAWNRGDLGGYLDAYWDSDETRYISESLKNVPGAEKWVIYGKQNIDKVFTDVFVRTKTFLATQATKKGVAGLLSLSRLQVTPAGPDEAVVFGEYLLELTESLRRTGLFTIHVRKENDRWVIVSEHSTSLPKEEGAVQGWSSKCTLL